MLGATIERGTGALKVKKGYGECPKPRTPEEFRRRMAVVSHSYLLAQLKFPQKAILRDLQPMHFLKYLDLMLGEHVLGLKAKNKDGQTVASPDFDLVLSYDFQIRRAMVKLANEGRLLHEAQREAMLDTTIKDPNVYSQVAVSHTRPEPPWRSRSAAESDHGQARRVATGMERAEESPAKEVERAKARKGASHCMTALQTADRFAGDGTIQEKGAGSTAADFMYVSCALGPILCMLAMEVESQRIRPVVGPTEVDSRPDEAIGRTLPRVRPMRKAQRGAREIAEQ